MLTVPQTAALLRTFDNILILTHVRPDGDTVGCAAALCAGLRSLGKAAFLLPNPELTDTTAPYFRPYEAPEGFTPDKVVSTDIATVGLFPENARPYAERVDLAIDHHPSFESFGRENIVRPEAAACGELIYDILSDLGSGIGVGKAACVRGDGHIQRKGHLRRDGAQIGQNVVD